MTYTLINLVFLIPALGLLFAALLRLRDSDPSSARLGSPADPAHRPAASAPADDSMTASRSRIHQRALAITAALLIGLTMIFDNLMIAAGLFTYDNHLGISIGLMPIEDLAYTIVAVAALPSLWLLLGHRRTPRRRNDPDRPSWPDDGDRPNRPDDADRRGRS